MVYSLSIIDTVQRNRRFSVKLTGARPMLPILEPTNAPAARGIAVRAMSVPCGLRFDMSTYM